MDVRVGLYRKQSWTPKNWCFWTVVLEKTLESPWDCKEIQPVHSKGDQLWDFFGRNDAKAETPVLWLPHVKSWLTGKDSHAGRDWGQEEKGTTEDEMAGWHHWLNGCEFEWTPGVGDGQGGLACYDSWGCKESDMTERLIWSDGKKSACHVGDPGLISELRRSPGEGHDNTFYYSCLDNSMDRGAWQTTDREVIKRPTWLSD